jgi:hypothetical protein
MGQAKAGVFFPAVENTSGLNDEIASLDVLVEAQMRILKEKLAGGETLFEMEADAARLTELVRSRRNKKEMLGVLSKRAGAAR